MPTQLRMVANIHRQLRHNLALLNQLKLEYVERGHEDVWLNYHTETTDDLHLVETMLFTICPLPELPALH